MRHESNVNVQCERDSVSEFDVRSRILDSMQSSDVVILLLTGLELTKRIDRVMVQRNAHKVSAKSTRPTRASLPGEIIRRGEANVVVLRGEKARLCRIEVV